MGQRHQIFVKIANPVKHMRLQPKEKTALIKELGNKDYAIVAYHNQWLYGRSALLNCLNLLLFGSQFSKEEKTSDKGFAGYDCPFAPKGMEQKFNTMELITNAIGFIMNFRAKNTDWLSAGIGGSWYIGKSDEGINFDFTRGDNNDGITIVDLVENKYCFMNINGNYTDEGLAYSASDLPSLKPVGAADYVKAYYGETVETINPYYLENAKDKTPKQIIAGIVKVNKKALKGFENFEVLTEAELKVMFSEMKQLNKA